MLGVTFGSHCEVVLHDLRRPEHSIVAIANGHVTGRKLGDPAIGGPEPDIALQRSQSDDGHTNILANYETHTRDGRRLKSSSTVFRDENGVLFAALCLNIDLTSIDTAKNFLETISATDFYTDGDLVPELPAARRGARGKLAETAPEESAVEVTVSGIITEAVAQGHKPLEAMNKADKLACVEYMYDRGLFIIRGAVELVAQALGVSRYTIYNYLDEIKARRSGGPAAAPGPDVEP